MDVIWLMLTFTMLYAILKGHNKLQRQAVYYIERDKDYEI